MKKKLFCFSDGAKRKIFYLCLVPFVLLLGISLFFAIDGVSGFCLYGRCEYYYGWRAFLYTFMSLGLIFTMVIPILPVCVLYILWYWLKYEKSSGGAGRGKK